MAALPTLAIPTTGAHADATTVTDQPTPEARADAEKAAETGEQVEVVGERTPYTTTFANPDGVTFTLKDSVVPVRTRQADGSWAQPDATLEERSDGTVGPKASVAKISFSDGGDGADLVKLSLNGRSLTVGWPGTLPKPTLDGDSAVYADVLPGVDLRMTATTEGYREVLVVTSASAAANPELKELSFPVRADGLFLRDGGGGGLSAVDDDGNAVFRAPAAQQWDSSGDASTSTSTSTSSTASSRSASQASFTTTAQDSAAAASPGDDGETTSDPTEGPSDGDTSTRLPVTAGQSTIKVTPDASMLADDSSVFPQYIDPDVGMTASERTLLSSDGDTFYNFSGGDDGKGVGYCGTYVTGGYAYYCGSGYKNRMYFEFSPAKLAGKHVLDATFAITEKWSMSCTPSWVDLVRTGNISSSTNWPGPTANWDLMVDRDVSAGRGSACDPSQPAAHIEFNDSPTETNENLTSTVTKFANGDFSRLTLMLKAHDETDPNGWKRFDDNAELDVKYVGIPAKPTKIGLVTGTSVACETSQSDPLVVSDPTPALQSTPQTAAGGESGASLKAVYSVDKYTASTATWATVFETARPTSGYVGDNVSPGSVPTSTLTEGALYRYRSWTRSYYNSGGDYLAGPSNGSTTGWCYFKVDPTRPKAPGVALSSPYSACTTDSCTAAGGPGTKVTFTFTPASGDSTNTAYEYKTTASAAWSAPVTGSTATATFTPPTSGTFSVYVRARDSIDYGATNAVDFLVAEGSGPSGQWHFDEASGAALDTSTTVAAEQDNATLSSSGASRDGRGRRGVLTHDATGAELATPVTDTGLTVDGTAGYAATSGAVVESRSSYTVEAWARMAATPTHNYVLLSQTGSGSTQPGFAIYYSTSYGKWIFNWHWTDSAGTAHFVRSLADTASPPVKVWTHLAGVYDADAGTIQLYVNGKAQGTPQAIPSGEPEADTGPLEFGRGNGATAGSFTDYFNGQIDEVTVWQRALSAQAVSTEARLLTADRYAATELMADWDPSAATGTSVPDTTSGYGTSLTLSGGASLDGTGIVLDGIDDAASAPGPLVDDTGSFTVTTAVQLDSTALAAKAVGYMGQVLGQRSADGSAWGLWYERTGSSDPDPETGATAPVGFWHFGRLNTDGSFTGVVSDDAVDLGSAVRLTGVFDAQSGAVSLYVGDAQNGDATAYTATPGTGDFAVGKAYVKSVWDDYLPAAVSDIRVWAGAMASQQQIVETVGD
ncbi:LamG domain-containing protein [Streptomyces sp. MBT62]|uniref:LamG domain-containing protein n=1 Tax=Streptomyces sp. MBT62 TaxID=2800410 RepID=UPI00190CD675|nr:LamG domain-containing protein [Streptomyces sp. MBT62]MBK3565984.1 laminin G domain-containing protein [Streptomyces sp. MBT62]